MNYTCQNCGNPLGFVTTSDGKYCINCFATYLKNLKKQNKRVIVSAFFLFLFPIILLIVGLYVTEIIRNISANAGHVASKITYSTIIVGFICGNYFVRNFKAYVGDPELEITTTTITSQGGVIKEKHREFSIGQIIAFIINIFLSVVGTVIIYYGGWLLFIITLIMRNKDIIIFRLSVKKMIKCFDFKINTIVNNINNKKLEVVNIRINKNEYPYLPCELVLSESDETELILGVLKLDDGSAFPLPILYYKKLGFAMPVCSVYECLVTAGKTPEEIKAAYDIVPLYYESMKQNWTEECNKLLGVEFKPSKKAVSE